MSNINQTEIERIVQSVSWTDRNQDHLNCHTHADQVCVGTACAVWVEACSSSKCKETPTEAERKTQLQDIDLKGKIAVKKWLEHF